jgi:hypothetical protein
MQKRINDDQLTEATLAKAVPGQGLAKLGRSITKAGVATPFHILLLSGQISDRNDFKPQTKERRLWQNHY